MNEESLRPKDINGNPIVLGDWYWAYDRAGRLVGAGKILAAIKYATLSFYINNTGYFAGNYEYAPIACQPPATRPRCPICGGKEHVAPLPGTFGPRCVKCCDVEKPSAQTAVPTHLQDPWGNLIKMQGEPVAMKPHTHCEPTNSELSKNVSRQIFYRIAPDHIERWEDASQQLRDTCDVAAEIAIAVCHEKLKVENRRLNTLLADYQNAETTHIRPLVRALGAIGILVDGTLDSYNERNKAKEGT